MRLPLSSRGAQPQPAERKHNGENHEPVLLHGTLFVYVRRARDLGRSHTIALEPDGQRKAAIKGKLTAGARFVGKKMLNAVRTTNHAAQKLVTRELGSFVEVEVAGDVVAKTNTNYNSRREPNWNEAFNIDLCHEVTYVRLRVKDRVLMGPNIRFGEVAVPAQQLAVGDRVIGDGLSLVKRTRQQFTNGLLDFELHMVQIDLRHAEQLPPTVPYCYFTTHEDCRVTLYQDAHQTPGSVPAVPWRGGGCGPSYCSQTSRFGGSSDSEDGTSARGSSFISDESDRDDPGSEWSDAVSVSSAGSFGPVLQHLQRTLTEPSNAPLPNPEAPKPPAPQAGAATAPQQPRLPTQPDVRDRAASAVSPPAQPAATPESLQGPGTAFASAAGAAVPLAPDASATIAGPALPPGGAAKPRQPPERTASGNEAVLDRLTGPAPPGSRLHASESMRSVSSLSTQSAAATAQLHHAQTAPATSAPPSSGRSPRLLRTPSYGSECCDGATFKVRNCWEELVCALQQAEDFIYIVGWSMHPQTRLTRTGPDGAGGKTIGELLKQKALNRVTVCLLIWDDKSSLNLPQPIGGLASLLGGSREGMMETHDEVTRSYFAGSDVRCEMLQRSGGKGNRLADGTVAAAFFSHHQKAVVCDTPPLPDSPSPHRRLVAFLGGLDLTKGRYDTAEHRLFCGRGGLFRGDWYNPSLPSDEADRPREPWHDVHCKIEGSACRDVMRNFEERWLRQVGESEASQLYASGAGHVGGGDDGPPLGQGARTTVQILRSIDGRSALLHRGAPFPALHYKKGRPIDHSILTAYVFYIRRARNFLYIENQYFIGSSFLWKHDRAWSCFHIIPAEILAKIVSKIRRRERFTAYIVIPLHPEGPPAPDLGQTLLRFQANTMQAMYRDIAAALAETCDPGVRDVRRAQDYLVFLTLGKREPEGGVRERSLQESPMDHADAFDFVDRRIDTDSTETASYARNAARSRRFMIYVHSKLLIADDEVAIVGSANINMRSMLGTRDTEIAAAIFQPDHLCEAHLSPASSAGGVGGDGGSASPRRSPLSASRHSSDGPDRAAPAAPPPPPPQRLNSWEASVVGAAGGDARVHSWKCPRGLVHHFRMSLFAEHFGRSSEAFRDPHSPTCLRQVLKNARRNWNIYADDKPAVGAMSGHVMLYPVRVHRGGGLSPRTADGMFPDAPGAYILPDRIAAPKYPSTLVT